MLQRIETNAGIICIAMETLRIIGDFSSVRAQKNHQLVENP